MRNALQSMLASVAVHVFLAAALLLMLLTLPVACQSAILRPPRLERVASATALPVTSESVFLPAPTATPPADTSPESSATLGANPSLSVWINESSVVHKQALSQLMATFEQEHQISIEWILVAPSLLPGLIETAVISGTLPDIVLHPASYTVGWAERGILDAAAADDIVDQIGRDTFDPAALAAVTTDGLSAAIPSDGYQQLLLYRADWVAELGLTTPDDYESMMAMAATLFDPTNLVSGIVIPTESNLITTQWAFEQIAAANGCQLIDEKGEILIREPACQEALDFYFSIVNQYSPVGVQTDVSARNAYLSGRTGMILTSPAILPRLAGLDSSAPPTCPQCTSQIDFLAQNSGIITRLTGSGPEATPANFGEITCLGITHRADNQAAAAFVDYWFNEGYETWLAVEPERKVPMRWGTTSDPRRYIDVWGTKPLPSGELSLVDIYGQEVVDQLRTQVADSSRWGFRQGQASLITTLQEAFILPVVLQEMLSGYFNSSQTIQEMYTRITDLIPNYEYYSDTVPAGGSGG